MVSLTHFCERLKIDHGSGKQGDQNKKKKGGGETQRLETKKKAEASEQARPMRIRRPGLSESGFLLPGTEDFPGSQFTYIFNISVLSLTGFEGPMYVLCLSLHHQAHLLCATALVLQVPVIL